MGWPTMGPCRRAGPGQPDSAVGPSAGSALLQPSNNSPNQKVLFQNMILGKLRIAI